MTENEGRSDPSGQTTANAPRWPEAVRRPLFSGWEIVVALALLAAVPVVNRPSFVIYHSFAEIFTVVIAISTGLVAWNARSFLENDYLLFAGIGQVFVAVIDIFHTLSYTGLTVFSAAGPNLSTGLWLAGRYLGSITVVVAALFIRRRAPLRIVLPVYLAVTVLLIVSVFRRWVPASYVNGLTPFKIYSEIAIALLFSIAAALLWRERRSLDTTVFRLMFASIVIRVVAEIFFTVYANVYDVFSYAGHYLRIVAFYMIYKAIFETGVVRPYALVVHDLREREDELRRSIQEHEAFSYSVSHDLRSPISVISGFAQLLESDESERMSAEGREYLAQIRGAIRRMTELIEDLLAFSRASRGDMSIEVVNVTVLARDIANRLRALDSKRKVEVEVEEGMVGKADERLLRVVLENLLGNAWKYTSRHEHAKIEIRRKEMDGEQVFLVRDDGAGFDMNAATGRLFKPFNRLHTPSEFEGTGIGLATVARIVERHGGRVWAESEVEKGTTIYFALPD